MCPSRGAIAQLGERIVRNDEVVGSIPTSSTNLLNALATVAAISLRLKNWLYWTVRTVNLWRRRRELLFLQRFDVFVEIRNAHLHNLFMALANAPEHRAPDRHFLVAMRHQTSLAAEDAGYLVGGILASV